MGNKKIEETISCYCDSCGYSFKLKSVDIKDSVVVIENVPLILSYFYCPKCEKLYRISVRDLQAEVLKNDLEEVKKLIRNAKDKKNISRSVMLDKMVKRKHQKLKEYLDKLNKKYNGKFYIALNEEGRKLLMYKENQTTVSDSTE